MFTIVRILHGGPFGGFTVANSTMAIDVLPSSKRTEGIGLYGISNNIGTALAPTVGILIYKYIGSFNVIFWLAFQNMIINLAENNRRATANSTILTSWDLGMGIGILLGGILFICIYAFCRPCYIFYCN